ncbi:MAG: hypothetical protein WBV55_15480 [Candidatus Sulfotelmatobacter sp.]
MTGSCWRLLACSSLIFLTSIFLASIFLASSLWGKSAARDHFRALTPIMASPPDTPRFSPVRLPLPIAEPWRIPVAPSPIGLPQITGAAGIIFSGRVTFVGRAWGTLTSLPRQTAASTMITFQVEHAVRGTTAGKNLTIHEWAGLWTSKERYRVGERVLLFLYPPSRLGLTSSVAGPMGRFAIDPQGRIKPNIQNISALAADPVIGGKKLVPYTDFFHAVRRASGEE